MGFFRRWREKKANKKINKLKNQENNLQGNDFLNKSETLTLRTNFDENNLLIAYEDEQDLKIDTDTSLEIKEDLDLEDLSSQQPEPEITTTKEFEKKTKQMIKNTTKDQKEKDIMKTKTIAIDTNDKKGRNIYYVSARKDKTGKKLGWEVKKENASKITKLCETKEQAIEYVKEKAGNQGSTCIIRKVDGSIDKTLKFDVPSSK
ncbi:MAG: DUF2188 domain-containing protein [Mycoplasmataceae bacterium]|nr:DUF2188 domain-containing protein [Mycoplasmataceae bacterium]